MKILKENFSFFGIWKNNKKNCNVNKLSGFKNIFSTICFEIETGIKVGDDFDFE